MMFTFNSISMFTVLKWELKFLTLSYSDDSVASICVITQNVVNVNLNALLYFTCLETSNLQFFGIFTRIMHL